MHLSVYRFGLRSSKGCVYWCNVGACTGLLVPVYNHPWDASIFALLVHLSIYRSRSTIIQEMCLILHFWYVNPAAAMCNGRTALDSAAEHSRLDMVRMLLHAGAYGDSTSEHRSALAIELARVNGHFAMARLLEQA